MPASSPTLGVRPIPDVVTVRSMQCDACDNGHDAAILFVDGSYGLVCPEAGFVPIERADLIAIAPDYKALAKQITAVLGCRARGPRRLAALTWCIGTARTDAADIAAFFGTSLQTTQDLRALEAALRPSWPRRGSTRQRPHWPHG